MKVRIREYDDAFEVAYIHVHNHGFAGPDTPYTNKVKSYNEDGTILKTFLAFSRSKVVGFVDIVEVEGAPDVVEIDPIGVLPEVRGRGIGSQLLDRVLEWANQANYSIVRALTSAGADEKLGRFFQRKGFQRTGQLIAMKDGNILKLDPTETLPVSHSLIRGHVYIYELEVGS